MGDAASDFLDFWGGVNPIAAATTLADNMTVVVSSVAAEQAPAADGNVHVSAAGGTSISAADFNANCKPNNFVALKYVQSLQDQLNRVATAKGYPLIGVDGQVGPGTLSLFKKVQAAFPTALMGDASSCLYISADADVLADQVKSIADTAGAPAFVTAPPGKAATIAGKVTGTPIRPPGAPAASVGDVFKGITAGQGVVLAGMAGLAVYLLKKKKKGRK